MASEDRNADRNADRSVTDLRRTRADVRRRRLEWMRKDLRRLRKTSKGAHAVPGYVRDQVRRRQDNIRRMEKAVAADFVLIATAASTQRARA